MTPIEALKQIESWPRHTRDDTVDTIQRMQAIARAALAAADRVRAGKDKRFINERAENVSLKVGIEDLMAENERLRAGLVKGEAERAALVEALKPFAWFASLLPKSVPDYMPLKADLSGSGDLTVAHLRAAALSLVRKGVCNAQRS